jgi:hypothetical protein
VLFLKEAESGQVLVVDNELTAWVPGLNCKFRR